MLFRFFQRSYLYFLASLTIPLLKWWLSRHGKAASTPCDGARRLLYVAASCRPYHITGYTSRTHAVVKSLCAAGIEVFTITRPGYPWDRKDRLVDPLSNPVQVDDVTYTHNPEPSHHRPVLLYALQGSKVIAAEAKRLKVSVIHAASNHVNALPALLAARSLGLRFHYEIRGIWELTRVSRFPEFASTKAFKRALDLEAVVAKHADRVYVISEQLGNYVIKNWGVNPSKVALLPNCVDPLDFVPADSSLVEPNTIGYAGSLLDYEGLDVLIRALALLKGEGVRLKLSVVGEGEVRPQLEALVTDLEMGESVTFLGRQPPDVARDVILKSALVCLPRKPFEVCQIVTPIKLVEALAMAKPVIVPDLPVFIDELRTESGKVPGWFFKAGDVGDLASVLKAAFADTDVLAQKSTLARSHAVTMRNWQRYVRDIYDHIPV